MKARLGFALASALMLLGLASATRAQTKDSVAGYEKVRKIAIGGEGGWDS